MIRVELKGYDEALGIWDQKPVRQAAVSTLKKISASAVTMVSGEIRRVYSIKKRDLDPLIRLQSPKGDLIAVIIFSGRGVPLALFNVRQTTGNRVITRTRGGLKARTLKRSAKVQGAQVEVEIGHSIQLRSAFFMNMQHGRSGVGVMQRDGKPRTPTREKLVISVAAMVQSTGVQPAVLQKVQADWDATFPRELEYYLNRGKSK